MTTEKNTQEGEFYFVLTSLYSLFKVRWLEVLSEFESIVGPFDLIAVNPMPSVDLNELNHYFRSVARTKMKVWWLEKFAAGNEE